MPHLADEFPEYYMGDSDGNFPWDAPGWGGRGVGRQRTQGTVSTNEPTFATFQEAAEWARQNPGRSFSRDPGGSGFRAK